MILATSPASSQRWKDLKKSKAELIGWQLFMVEVFKENWANKKACLPPSNYTFSRSLYNHEKLLLGSCSFNIPHWQNPELDHECEGNEGQACTHVDMFRCNFCSGLFLLLPSISFIKCFIPEMCLNCMIQFV